MKLIDLFSGAGGMSLGFQNAGFDIALAIDNWDAAVACYKKNFKHPVLELDLHDVPKVVAEVKKIKPEIIIGGPPCQDFSEAGSRKEGARAQLTSDYAMTVSECSPEYFVMENVPRARLSNAYKKARKIFVAAGYGLTEIVLDACYCGVPQRRKRFFCIGAKNKPDGFLERILYSRQSDVALSLRDYFGDKLSFDFYYQHPRTYARRGVYSVDEPAATVRGANRPMPKKYKRHKLDAAAPHRNGIRALTVAERAMIQMFPSDYAWSDSQSANNQMIGNAVPVGLAQFVAAAVWDYAQKNGNLNVPMTFMEWGRSKFHLTYEASRDMLSRYRRARKLVGRKYTTDGAMAETLQAVDVYKKMSHSIQSQLLHAVALHEKYESYKESISREIGVKA